MAGMSYVSRPAKHIQRRMIVDALRRLTAFDELANYEYVGFGGMEFVDFELVHRELGIARMVSIEKDSHGAGRYKFNAPFSDVDLYFDRASAVLPSLLDDSKARIIWLDYECALNHEVLQDVGTCLRKMPTGGALLVSVNAQGPREAAERLEQFIANVGEERLPSPISNSTLAKWGWADASYRVLIADALADVARRGDGARFEQIFHFRYSDGARMLTWGGILVGSDRDSTFATAGFGGLDQIRFWSDDPYVIAPPLVTMREALHLNRQLPDAAPDRLQADGIPSGDLESYADLYRWYPPIPAAM